MENTLVVTLSAGELGSTSENNLREITSGMRPVKAGVRNRFRYSVARDLYCCLVIQSEHDVLIDI